MLGTPRIVVMPFAISRSSNLLFCSRGAVRTGSSVLHDRSCIVSEDASLRTCPMPTRPLLATSSPRAIFSALRRK